LVLIGVWSLAVPIGRIADWRRNGRRGDRLFVVYVDGMLGVVE
jgi:hypothetical protein